MSVVAVCLLVCLCYLEGSTKILKQKECGIWTWKDLDQILVSSTSTIILTKLLKAIFSKPDHTHLSHLGFSQRLWLFLGFGVFFKVYYY